MIARSRSAGDIAGTAIVAARDERAELGELERPVVEVGAQRGQHPQPAVGRGDRGDETVDERSTVAVGREREHLLELIDDEQQFGAVGQHRRQRAVDAVRCGEILGDRRAAPHRDLTQCARQLLHRHRTGHHRCDEPAVRTRQLTPAHPGQHTRSHEAGLPGARATDDEDQPTRHTVGGEAGDDLGGGVLASEEVLGVGLVEGEETLVRVVPPGWAGRAGLERHEQLLDEDIDRRCVARGEGGGDDIAHPLVVDRATDQAGEGPHIVAEMPSCRRPAEVEIGQTWLATVVVQDVPRAHSAVHDTEVGRGRERAPDPSHQRGCFSVAERIAPEPVGEAAAMEAGRHDERGAGLAPEVVDRHDRPVPDRRDPSRARLERAHEARFVGDCRRQHPHDEVAVDARHPGGEHRPVAPGAEASADPVPAQLAAGGLALVQRRVMAEDLAFQLLELGGRIETEILGERAPVLLVRAQGVGLPAGSVLRQHQLRLEPLAERMLVRSRLQLGDQLDGTAASQLHLEQQLQRGEPQLSEPLGFRTGPFAIGELGVRIAAPQREGTAQQGDRPIRIRQPGRSGLGDRGLEPVHIEGTLRDPEHVAGGLRDDQGR